MNKRIGIGRRRWPYIFGVLAAVVTVSSHADSLRCRHGIVTTGDNKATVLEKCGEPVVEKTVAFIRRKEKSSMHSTATHAARPRIRENLVEHWTYHMGAGRFQRILVFEAGLLSQINQGPRQ